MTHLGDKGDTLNCTCHLRIFSDTRKQLSGGVSQRYKLERPQKKPRPLHSRGQPACWPPQRQCRTHKAGALFEIRRRYRNATTKCQRVRKSLKIRWQENWVTLNRATFQMVLLTMGHALAVMIGL